MPERMEGPRAGYDIWNRIPEIEERAPIPPPGTEPVPPDQARDRLAQLVGQDAESRPAQSDFAAISAQAFAPRDDISKPHVVLAEAGTGIGKTLGYVAPASLWAEINKGPVWLSTYTKNLQRQIDRELERLYPDPADKARYTVVRKGRENYLCLLNFEEAVSRSAGSAGDAGPGLGLIARWAMASRDGDMIGGDLPAWIGPNVPAGLTDRRGECLHSACPHVRKCFIEKAVRKSRRARLVVANHALVMIQAAIEYGLSGDLPAEPKGDDGEDGQGLSGDQVTRVVFDEGHQLFDAADGAFSAHLTGLEAFDLRRWIRGAEGDRRTRGRGLRERIGDLMADESDCARHLDNALSAAAALPGAGWVERLAGSPRGPVETLLHLVRQQVLARAPKAETGHDLEAPLSPPVPGLLEAARSAVQSLGQLGAALTALSAGLRARLADEAADLDSQTRLRIEGACRSLDRRGRMTVPAWIEMLRALDKGADPDFVDWIGISRQDGREVDVGLHRHHVDPTRPFSEAVLERAHGVLVTSATLRDRTPGPGDDWTSAELRTGSQHLLLPARRVAVPSPFDYPARTRVLIVTDVRRDEQDEVAAAYRELFLAAGGGALGLFTAIERLRGVHRRIAPALEMAGIDLLAQHVDGMDTGTLVDIFRAEPDSCLLGTDAVRDGVDVPGRALRLIVFDRVP
jgi:ATP-dependent DNA helicase DinG